MWFDLTIALAVAGLGLFVGLRLFASALGGPKKKAAKVQQQKQAPKKAAAPAAAPAAAKKGAKAAAPAKGAKAAPAKKEAEPEPVEKASPKLHQQGMSAEKFVVLTLEDLQKQNAAAQKGTVTTNHKPEFTQRQRERDEAKGFKVVSKDFAPAVRKPKTDETLISQKEQFDRKLSQFFKGGDRKKQPYSRRDEATNEAALGGKVAMKSNFGTGRTWGAISDDN